MLDGCELGFPDGCALGEDDGLLELGDGASLGIGVGTPVGVEVGFLPTLIVGFGVFPKIRSEDGIGVTGAGAATGAELGCLLTDGASVTGAELGCLLTDGASVTGAELGCLLTDGANVAGSGCLTLIVGLGVLPKTRSGVGTPAAGETMFASSTTSLFPTRAETKFTESEPNKSQSFKIEDARAKDRMILLLV